jgi:hypothetical protein
VLSKPKPVKKEKTIEDKIKASKWCKKHNCFKWICSPHKPSKAKPKKPIQVKPKSERRKFSQSERTELESELDMLCSIYIRNRDRRCVTCGSTKTECSHFVKRSHQIVRFDIEINLNGQCSFCNNLHNSNEEPLENYLIKKHGSDKVNLLKSKTKITHFRFSVPELREMVFEMKRKVYGDNDKIT